MEVERRGMETRRADTEKGISISEILGRAERAYAAYLEAQKHVAEAYRESELSADAVFRQKDSEARLNLIKAIDVARKVRSEAMEQAIKVRDEAMAQAMEERDETIMQAEQACQTARVEAYKAYIENLKQILEHCDKTVAEVKGVRTTTQDEMWDIYNIGELRISEAREVIITYKEYKSALDGDLGLKPEKLKELEGRVGRLIDLKAGEAGFKVTDETRTNIGRLALLLSSKVGKTVGR